MVVTQSIAPSHDAVIRRYLSIADRDLDEPDFKPPPKTVNLIEMMPYLFSMANGLRKMRWRLVAAIAAMMISKAAGLSVPILFKQAGTGYAHLSMQAA